MESFILLLEYALRLVFEYNEILKCLHKTIRDTSDRLTFICFSVYSTSYSI